MRFKHKLISFNGTAVMILLSKLIDFIGLKNSNTGSVKTYIPVNELNEAIDRVVDGIEPKMRYFPGYKKILNKGVSTSLAYISDLVETIPEAILISNKTFFKDPKVNAYFATIEDIQDIFGGSDELRSFFEVVGNANQDEAYALLCMNKTEKNVLGMDLKEDMILRDVMQKALNLSEHKILSPAVSEGEVRKGIKLCIFDGLITHSLQKILELKEQKKGLEIQRSILISRLKTRQSQGSGLSKMLASASAATLSVDIEQQISQTDKKLEKLPASWEAPEYYLEVIKNILLQPESFIRIKVDSFNINKMGIVSSDEASNSVNCIQFTEIVIANVLKRVVAIVRYPRSEMQPRKEFNPKL